jgi:hypothetical protein
LTGAETQKIINFGGKLMEILGAWEKLSRIYSAIYD